MKNNFEKVIDINEVIQAKRVEFESFEEILMIASANLLPSNNLASLTEWRSDPKLIIGYIYKFKIF